MRKVEIKHRTVPTKEHPSVYYLEYGSFIQYGLDVVELDHSVASFTVAVIELESGQVILSPLHNIRFV